MVKVLRTWLAFGDLKPGERFRFLYGWPPDSARPSEEVYTKGGGGWYTDVAGRKFQTGRFASVRLEK